MKAILATFGTMLLLTACTTTVTDSVDHAIEQEEAGNRAIGFRTPAVARAAIDDAMSDDFTAFDVWGWYAPSGSSDYAPLFGSAGGAGEEVSRAAGNANWSYDGTRYWQDDHTYRFYALFPSNLPNASYADDGTLTIGSYNAKANDDDLMAASVENIAGSLHQPVAFQFQHLLARVSVIVRTAQGVKATVSGASLYGIHDTGNYNSASTAYSGWTVTGEASSAANPSYSMGGAGSSTDINENNEAAIFADLLTLPQSVSGLTLHIGLTRQVGSGTPDDLTGEYNLGTTITRWSAGQHYRYVMTVEADAITFSNFTVDPWGETHTGGDINIGQTN